ncbi:uncharacterized protein [Anabrus simplex]|uniref:uncharacterized protein n=1 Tax=Anabrus simplex TaxID=316456 RepID=UPI0034DCEBDA
MSEKTAISLIRAVDIVALFLVGHPWIAVALLNFIICFITPVLMTVVVMLAKHLLAFVGLQTEEDVLKSAALILSGFVSGSVIVTVIVSCIALIVYTHLVQLCIMQPTVPDKQS